MTPSSLFWLALILFLITQALQIWSSPRPTIVKLELAFTEARAEPTLTAWGDAGRARAVRNLWLDFLYIAGYVALLLASIHWAIRPAGIWLFRYGSILSGAVIAAGLLDLLENVLLLLFLSPRQAFPGALLAIAGSAAALKFFLLLAVVVTFVGWLVWK